MQLELSFQSCAAEVCEMQVLLCCAVRLPCCRLPLIAVHSICSRHLLLNVSIRTGTRSSERRGRAPRSRTNASPCSRLRAAEGAPSSASCRCALRQPPATVSATAGSTARVAPARLESHPAAGSAQGTGHRAQGTGHRAQGTDKGISAGVMFGNAQRAALHTMQSHLGQHLLAELSHFPRLARAGGVRGTSVSHRLRVASGCTQRVVSGSKKWGGGGTWHHKHTMHN
jgi:hypothetical protein